MVLYSQHTHALQRHANMPISDFETSQVSLAAKLTDYIKENYYLQGVHVRRITTE